MQRLVDQIYKFFQPELKEENKHFLQLCIRTPIYFKSHLQTFSIKEIFVFSCFLNSVPNFYLLAVYPLYYGSFRLAGVIMKKPKSWAIHHCFKNFSYPLWFIFTLFIMVRLQNPNAVIEKVFKEKLEFVRQQKALQNENLYDKVRQLNTFHIHEQEILREKSKKSLKNTLDFGGVQKKVFEKQEIKEESQNKEIRKFQQPNFQEGDPVYQSLLNDIQKFIKSQNIL